MTVRQRSILMMNDRPDCPFGAESCPHVSRVENQIKAMTKTMNRILYVVYFVAGIVAVELGIVII